MLTAAASKLEQAFSELPQPVRNESDWGEKILKVTVDIAQDKAREFGITSEDVSQVMDAYFSGMRYSTFREGDEQIPIVLRASPESRDSVEDLANLSIAAGGEIIAVDEIARFRPRLEYSEIRRENQERRLVVSGKSAALSAAQTLARIQPAIDGLQMGPGYRVEIGGELEDSADVASQMGANLPIAIAVMLAALVFQFNSMRRALATFMTIPLILIGAPYALLALGHPMSFFAMLGLMSLMGIIINNAIVLINQVDVERGSASLDEAIETAAVKRARPIMLTSLTTVCGLLPLASGGGALFEPMAIIMIGGLLVASPVTLVFVPPLYRLLARPPRLWRGPGGPSRPASTSPGTEHPSLRQGPPPSSADGSM